MGLFQWRRSPHAPAGPKIPIAEKTDTAQAQVAPAPAAEPKRKGSTKTQVYSVRVPKGFKGEIQSLQARLQLEREQGGAKARKVSGAEMLGLMLESYKVSRRNGESTGNAVPIPDVVWFGVREIARHRNASPADILEELVAEKLANLGLAAWK